MPSDVNTTGLRQYGEIQVHPMEMKNVFHESSIAGLSPKFRDELKCDVFEVNRAWGVAGEAMKACILLLDDIKRNYPKQFKSVCENELDFSDTIAYDMVKAAPWVREHDIPDAFLANISARSLRLIATEKVEKIKAALTEMIIQKEGAGVAESDIRKKIAEMKGRTGKTNKDVKEVSERAKNELAKDASADQVKAWYEKAFDNLDAKLNTMDNKLKEIRTKNEGIREENKKLREEIATLKKQVPTTEDSKKLIGYVKSNPQAVKMALGFFDTAKEKKEEMIAKAEATAAAVAS